MLADPCVVLCAGCSVPMGLFRLLCQPHNYLEVSLSCSFRCMRLMFYCCVVAEHLRDQIRFLDVYEPTDAEKKDADLYARNVRRVSATFSRQSMLFDAACLLPAAVPFAVLRAVV